MRLTETLYKIIEQDYQEKFNLPDWEFRELPQMKIEYWNDLVRVIGESNIYVISGSRKQLKQGTIVSDMFRADIMISPEGLTRLKNFNEGMSND